MSSLVTASLNDSDFNQAEFGCGKSIIVALVYDSVSTVSTRMCARVGLSSVSIWQCEEMTVGLARFWEGSEGTRFAGWGRERNQGEGSVLGGLGCRWNLRGASFQYHGV